jgi:serine/threonine-protein kinase
VETSVRTIASERREHQRREQRAGMRRLLLVGLITWPFFFISDVMAALAEHRADAILAMLVVRAAAWLLVFAAFLLIARVGSLSLRALTVLDFSIPAIIGGAVAVRALYLGGLDSKLALGLLVGGVTRAALLPTRWPRTFAAAMVTPLMFPAVLGLASLASPALRAQFASPALGAFLQVFVMSALAIAMATFASHMTWAARQEVFETRRLGSYRLKARIGKGGHGDVWLATQQALKRDVAVKVLHSAAGVDEESVARFEREARAASALVHPNTIRIFDYGATRDGVSFIAMELLTGRDLASLVEETGPLSAARVIHIARQACGSLAEAHAAGIVHRDIKPANLFLTRVGDEHDFLKVLDFGVARLTSESTLSRDAAFVGTPAYMSPEICSSAAVDARSDVYSLGAAMYFMLTGRTVFPGRTLGEIVASQVSRLPEPPSRICPVPPDLEEVVMRCLCKRPEDRFASMIELEAALAKCEDASSWEKAHAWRESSTSRVV